MTTTEFARPTASDLAIEAEEAANLLAEQVAAEVKRVCAEAGEQILLQRLTSGIQTEFTPQDAVLAQLKASMVVARLIDLLQAKWLLEGQGLGLSNPAMADALGLKSGEAVRQKIIRAVSGANRFAE